MGCFSLSRVSQPGKDVKAATANEADILRKQLQSVENRLQEEAMLRNEAHVERVRVAHCAHAGRRTRVPQPGHAAGLSQHCSLRAGHCTR